MNLSICKRLPNPNKKSIVDQVCSGRTVLARYLEKRSEGDKWDIPAQFLARERFIRSVPQVKVELSQAFSVGLTQASSE